MKEFQERRKMNRFIYSWPVISLLIVLNIAIGVRLFSIFKESRAALKEGGVIKSELETLKIKKDRLEAEVNRLSTDEGVEEELRRRFGVSKAGEETLVIVANNLKASATNATKESPKGVLGDLISFFRSLF